jgi:hypothetical protein
MLYAQLFMWKQKPDHQNIRSAESCSDYTDDRSREVSHIMQPVSLCNLSKVKREINSLELIINVTKKV